MQQRIKTSSTKWRLYFKRLVLRKQKVIVKHWLLQSISHIFLISKNSLQLFSTQSTQSFPNADVVLSSARQSASAPCDLIGLQSNMCLCKFIKENECGGVNFLWLRLYFLDRFTSCILMASISFFFWSWINWLELQNMAYIPM